MILKPITIKKLITSILFLLILNIYSDVYALREFIIDTDAAADDIIAILYLLQHPEIKIKALSIVGNGEAHCEPALNNIRGLLQMVHQSSIPVACGREKPLEGDHHFPAFLTEEADTLSNTTHLLPKVKKQQSSNAVDLLITTLRQSKQPISILAIGPLTNIAEALLKEPQLKKHIKEIFIMGGAISVPGNITKLVENSPNETAEWNLYIDPVAANLVFKQIQSIYLIPLDLTDKFPLDMNFFYEFQRQRHSIVTQYVFELLKNNLKWIRSNNFYFWDCLAAVIASNPHLVKFNRQKIKIVIYPEAQSGTTIIDEKEGNNVLVATDIKSSQFKILLVAGLNQRHH